MQIPLPLGTLSNTKLFEKKVSKVNSNSPLSLLLCILWVIKGCGWSCCVYVPMKTCKIDCHPKGLCIVCDCIFSCVRRSSVKSQ